jgi:hypothetical protein
LFYSEKGGLPGLLDLDTGSFREFDWPLSEKDHPQRMRSTLNGALYLGRCLAAGDANAGVPGVAARGQIYRVPPLREARQIPLKWSPAELK